MISPLFPSHIPFWIRVKGIPVHFWHEKMIYNIGQELGTLEDYKITKTSTRMRVLLDGLKPLVKESVIDFASGEETPFTLEYEELEYHCSRCNMLTHLSRSCPLAAKETQLPQAPIFPQTVNGRASYSQAPTTAAHCATCDSAFRTRVDRHGSPFGDRVQTQAARGHPLTNKITPTVPTHATHAPYPNRDSQRDHRDNIKQWREKQFQPSRKAQRSTKTRPPGQVETSIINTSRPPLERNLALHDFPTPTLGVPTREEVLNEFREASYQYTNVEDPQERAARQQRVLQTEMDGSVKKQPLALSQLLLI